MLKTSEDTEKYISCSKVNIDNYIHKNEYRKAFWLLILFLERHICQRKIVITTAKIIKMGVITL